MAANQHDVTHDITHDITHALPPEFEVDRESDGNAKILEHGRFSSILSLRRRPFQQTRQRWSFGGYNHVATKVHPQTMISDYLDIWKLISHRNIIPLLGMQLDLATGNMILFMPAISGGDLFNRSFTPLEWRPLAGQLVSAIEYMTITLKILHMDIKPENILIDDRARTIYVTDFEFAVKIPTVLVNRGTREFIAPECLQNVMMDCGAPDVFSLGCLFAEVLGGKQMQDTSCNTLSFDLRQKHIDDRLNSLFHDNLVYLDLIASMTRVDWRQRPAIDVVRQHLWFRQWV